MRIREGDPLEIFVSNEGEVIFKKYSPIKLLLLSKENLRFLIFNPPTSNISFLTYSQTPWQQEVAYCPDNILPPLYLAYGSFSARFCKRDKPKKQSEEKAMPQRVYIQ